METYEKKYKEALERAKKLHQESIERNGDRVYWAGDLESIFPELRESEDERIRKAVIDFFSLQDDNTTYSLIPKKDILAWLEKQKEQKPSEWSEEDEHRKSDAIYFLETAKKHYASTLEIEATISWLKSLRPQPHWKPTEEQMKALKLWAQRSDAKKLISLYNDLKKQM